MTSHCSIVNYYFLAVYNLNLNRSERCPKTAQSLLLIFERVIIPSYHGELYSSSLITVNLHSRENSLNSWENSIMIINIKDHNLANTVLIRSI